MGNEVDHESQIEQSQNEQNHPGHKSEVDGQSRVGLGRLWWHLARPISRPPAKLRHQHRHDGCWAFFWLDFFREVFKHLRLNIFQNHSYLYFE